MTLPATARAADWEATARRLAPTCTQPAAPPDPATVTLWAHVAALTGWLDAHRPPDSYEITFRVLKLAEETGEAVAAYIGMTGANPRKGVHASPADVHRELCDVAITALVALATLTGGPDQAAARLQHHLVTHAAGLAARTRASSQEPTSPASA